MDTKRRLKDMAWKSTDEIQRRKIVYNNRNTCQDCDNWVYDLQFLTRILKQKTFIDQSETKTMYKKPEYFGVVTPSTSRHGVSCRWYAIL